MRTLLLWMTALTFSAGIVALPLVESDPPRYPERYESAASFDIVTPNAPPAHAEVPDYSGHIADLRQQRARASRGRARASRGVPRTCDERCLAAIASCEGSGHINADHPGPSSATGKYGVLRGTWDNWGGYRDAKDATEAEQDQWAREAAAAAGTRPWLASKGCWGPKLR